MAQLAAVAVLATILAALFAVLTLASSAWAGCAWVLWGQYTRDTDFKEESFVSLAFETKSGCDEQATLKNDRETKQFKPGQYAKGAASPVFWQCLPDTVDPRGLKGSGR